MSYSLKILLRGDAERESCCLHCNQRSVLGYLISNLFLKVDRCLGNGYVKKVSTSRIAVAVSEHIRVDESIVLHFKRVQKLFFCLLRISLQDFSVIPVLRRSISFQWTFVGLEQDIWPCAPKAITLLMSLTESSMSFFEETHRE